MGQHDDLMAAALQAVTAIEKKDNPQPSVDDSRNNLKDAVKAVNDISLDNDDFDLEISITSFDEMLHDAVQTKNDAMPPFPGIEKTSGVSEGNSVHLDTAKTEINPAVVRPSVHVTSSTVRPKAASVKLLPAEPVVDTDKAIQTTESEVLAQVDDSSANAAQVEAGNEAQVESDTVVTKNLLLSDAENVGVSADVVAAYENRIAELEAKLQETSSALEETYKRALEINDENEQLKVYSKQLSDRLVRNTADFDNYRKRVVRDQEQTKNQVEERIVLGFLPVMDNLARAIIHARQSQDYQKLLQGVEMTGKLYLGVLSKNGCVPYDSMGAEFDPVYHDVLQRVVDPDKPHNTVVQEHLKGYIMHDRVIRPALVVVSQHEDEN